MSTLMSLVLLLLMVVVRRKSLRMSLDVRVLLVILMVLTGAMMLLMLMLLLLLRIYWILWVRCRRLVTVLLMPLMLFLPLLLSLRMGMVLSRLRPVIGGRIPLMLLLLVGRSTAPVLGICLLVPLDGRMRQGRRMRICFRRSSAGRSALICGSCRSTALLLLMRLMSVLVVRWRRAILTAAVLSVVVVHGLLPLALALTLNLLLLLRLLLTG